MKDTFMCFTNPETSCPSCLILYRLYELDLFAFFLFFYYLNVVVHHRCCESMRYVIIPVVRHPPFCHSKSCVGIHFCPPFLLLSFPTSPSLSRLSCPTFHFSPFLLSLVSISPPGADPQLCGVPVLLPTWAERLFPPGPPPGANDRAVPGRRQPLQHLQPQQQVGRTRTTPDNDFESR